MYVLHVNSYYQPFGGAEITTLKQMRLAEVAGHRVGIIYFCGDEYSDPQAGGGARCARRIDALQRAEVVLRQLVDVIEREHPDLVHYHNCWAVPNLLFEARLPTLAPSILHEHGHTLTCANGNRMHHRPFRPCVLPLGLHCFAVSLATKCCPRHHPLRLLRRLKAMRMLPEIWGNALVVTPSEFVRNELTQNGFNGDNVHVLPNYTKLPYTWHPPRGNDVLYVGRIEKIKGVEDLVESVAGLPCMLRIIGTGSYETTLKSIVAHRGLQTQVQFCGAMSPEQLAPEYDKARIVVFPSRSHESFGNVGIEAMSYGRPVVAYDAGGTRQWLTDGVTGYSVPMGDKVMLRARIRELLADRTLTDRMATAARQMCERSFSEDAYKQRLLHLYDIAAHGQGQETTRG